MASNPNLPITGRNVALSIFVNGSPLQATDLVQKIRITEVNVQYRDKYLNRDFDRTDEQPIGYDVNLTLHYAGSQLINALLAQKAARLALLPVPVITIGATLQARDGTAHGYAITNCTAKVDMDFSGKDERGMITLSVQGEQLLPISL